jgi:2-oxoisovalerate ferredoxin oxidoreductase beta subunit
LYFINNAIYGMTGGQMAPTTLVSQKTTTTPGGRDPSNGDGYPMGMCEIISTLKAPAFIERVSLADIYRIYKAKKAIKKALQVQIDRKGFSFVEILSPCPINWKMDPLTARDWIKTNLEPVFPIQNFRDWQEGPVTPRLAVPKRGENLLKILGLEEKRLENGKNTYTDASVEKNADKQIRENAADQMVKIAGFGGQGIMFAGVFLAQCGMNKGLQVSWLPSYGPEMRGGTAYSSVILSGDVIGSPVVDDPNVLVAMNPPSLAAFEHTVQPGGMILVNSSLIDMKVQRTDVKVYYIPATDLAHKIGAVETAAMIMLSKYASESGILGLEDLKTAIIQTMKKKDMIGANIKALEMGFSGKDQQ